MHWGGGGFISKYSFRTLSDLAAERIKGDLEVVYPYP